jgi:SAM-dependent methyltransferase
VKHGYWDARYRAGGTSGAGSQGEEAAHKAELVQGVISERGVRSMLDLGCGDGVVAAAIFVASYVGYDPAPAALTACRKLMPWRRFTPTAPVGERFDIVLSMDVIFHLVEDAAFKGYMHLLFGCDFSDVVLVYGTNHHQRGAHHVLHRRWLGDIPSGWTARALPCQFKSAWLVERSGT